jgi:hypothetical protein
MILRPLVPCLQSQLSLDPIKFSEKGVKHSIGDLACRGKRVNDV